MDFDTNTPARPAKRAKQAHTNRKGDPQHNRSNSFPQQWAMQQDVHDFNHNGSNEIESGPSPNSADASTLELRSCEACRRGKLKCSRTNPCTKCAAKSVLCVYEEEKRRGPRPGYIDELNRRINDLEYMVLGQSMMLDPDRGQNANLSFHDAVANMKRRLTASGSARSHGLEEHEMSSAHSQDLRDIESLPQAPAELPSKSRRQHMCDVYFDQIHPWIPMIHRDSIYGSIDSIDAQGQRGSPVLQAVLAASNPLIDRSLHDEKYYQELQESVYQQVFVSADLERLQSAVVLAFLMCGNGTITSNWGLVTYLVQFVTHAGLHVEDMNLSDEQRQYRRMVKFDGEATDWIGKETMRRLFWIIFLLDRLTSILSGLPPRIKSSDIKRRLPCDGQKWQDGVEVETREFVPAAIAVNMQLSMDSNIGGLTYLIEATEILGIITSFASRTAKTRIQAPNLRDFLQEFLNLDLILTNWKSRLPPRYQRASYDEQGYMDHNITLAHLSHNTSVIVLYQTARHIHELGLVNNHVQSAWLPQLSFVKDAAKEVAKICARFLLHRRYLVSPQFILCQFIAARALLAYSSSTMERVDEDFEILHTSLVESYKRWNGLPASHDSTASEGEPNDLASALLARLVQDMSHSNEIDISTHCTHLLNDMQTKNSQQSTTNDDFTHTAVEVHPNGYMGVEDGQPTSARAANGNYPTYSTELPFSAANMTDSMPILESIGCLNRAMPFSTSPPFEGVDDRIFSWKDCEVVT